MHMRFGKKKTVFAACVFLALVLLLSMVLNACNEKGQSGGTIDEPEITPEYLAGEYAEQLVRDGASVILGTFDVQEEDSDVPWITIHEKSIVQDPASDDGYYISDKNLSYDYQISDNVRVTFVMGNDSLVTVLDKKNFIDAVLDDREANKTDPDYKDKKLYEFYVMGDQVELILAQEL